MESLASRIRPRAAASTPLRSAQNDTPPQASSPNERRVTAACRNLPQLRLSRPGTCSRALRMAISETASTTHSKLCSTDPRRFAIRRGIAKVDRNRHAVAHGEFHGVKVVTEILIQSQNALLDLLQNFLRRMPLRLVTQMKRIPWLVGHDPDVTLINRIATEIHVELDFLLQHHHQLGGIVVSAEEFLAIMQSIDVLPAATGERFEKRGPADVIKNPFPIERIAEISKRLVVRIWRRLI